MSWTNVKLIFLREVRDQLRDRRTLFMIFVLPVVLYPLLGLSFFQFGQFIRKHATSVLVVGADRLPDQPALIEGAHFAPRWFADPHDAHLLELFLEDPSPELTPDQRLQGGPYDVLVVFPPDFAERLARYRQQIADRTSRSDSANAAGDAASPEIPRPQIYFNSALEKSQLSYLRVHGLLERWRDAVGRENLLAGGLPAVAAQPFELAAKDVAPPQRREGAVWSKVFPFLLLIWAMTGAFYPAIDLCAGEKERGTLETLLSSPAARIEIVCGKLCTVMLFSISTVILNIVSMGVTGLLIISQLREIGPPPASAFVWLLLALLPISALFSALCLALAAFARSTKEGQYYLMPLLLISMPLVVVAILPGVELNLGSALIPVTGVVLLLRTLLEGNYWQALPFVPPVLIVTLVCCALAIRWAVDQFNTESVLFRESERLDLGLWLRHLLRDREDTPSVSEAIFCGVLILFIRFFLGFALPTPSSFDQLVEVALVTQLVVIATPALFMTVMLTRSPRKTLLLQAPPWLSIPAALLLAVFLHPVAAALSNAVTRLYPVDARLAESLGGLLRGEQSWWQLMLVFALAPAIAEELAFRGFMLSGFRRSGYKWRAIIVTSVLFGMTHAILQQSLVAMLVGVVIGYIAVQTGSIVPCMLFHLVHNGLRITAMNLTPEMIAGHPLLNWAVERSDEYFGYHPLVVGCAALLSAGVLYWFHRQTYERTAEEELQDAIRRHSAPASA